MTLEGDDQRWNPNTYDDAHSFVAAYGSSVVDLLEPSADERILDLGCGTGHLAWEIADAGAAVVGLDASAEMIARARETYSDSDSDSDSNSNSEATDTTLEFVHADARTLTRAVDGPFDAVFSNAALHWIPDDDQDAVLTAVHDVLEPDGRFVAELGGQGNVAAIVDAVRAEGKARGYEIESPWYFPSIGEYARRLEDHGLEVQYATLFDRPTELEGEDGLRTWLEQFGDPLFASASASVPADERAEIVEAVEDRLREGEGENEDEEYYRDGTWVAPYRRLRFVAVAK